MFSLTIQFGEGPTAWNFLFKEIGKTVITAEAARIAMGDEKANIEIEDDFGQLGTIAGRDIKGVLLQDLDLLEESSIQRSLSQARAQAKMNDRIKLDPVLRVAMAQQRGPSMLTPFSNGGFNG